MSPNQRLWARKLIYLPLDILGGLFGKGEQLMPPRGDIYTGPGDFLEIGEQQVELLRRLIDLRPTDTVLDIGSGIGRTAIPLTKYLESTAVYEGFDVVEKGVTWCQKHISRKFPNFSFRYVPIHNDLYNDSTQQASKFTFPYPSNRFDKIFLFSVFTHMMPEEIENYLGEIDRVLKPEGSCLATFFLYNGKNGPQITAQEGFQFPYLRDGYRLLDDQVRSANIAVDEERLRQMLKGKNLVMDCLIEGYWKASVGKTGTNDFQDMVVFTRKGN